MSLANEQRQGMLQASSSWLTCIWHNVPCADRCRVAVWSSGFYHCKRIRHDWCSGKADSMNYGGLIRACRKWFILLQNMVIHHICLHGYMVRVHIVFCSFFSFIFTVLVRNFRGRQSMTIESKVTILYAKQNGSKKDKVCSLKIGCGCKGAKKCVMFLTWQMHCLAWWHWAWQHVRLPGHLLGLCVSILVPRAVSIVFQYPLAGAL